MALPGKNNNQGPSFGGNRGSAPAPASVPSGGPGPSSGGASDFFDLDFSGVETFVDVDPGWYEAYIESISQGVSSGGYPQLEITYRFASDSPHPGRRQKYWLVKTPKTVWKVKQFLEACGLDESEMNSVRLTDLIGVYHLVQMGTDDYNDRVKVLDFRPSQTHRGEVFRPGAPASPGLL